MDRKVYGTSPRGEMLEDRGVLPREDGDLLRDNQAMLEENFSQQLVAVRFLKKAESLRRKREVGKLKDKREGLQGGIIEDCGLSSRRAQRDGNQFVE